MRWSSEASWCPTSGAPASALRLVGCRKLLALARATLFAFSASLPFVYIILIRGCKTGATCCGMLRGLRTLRSPPHDLDVGRGGSACTSPYAVAFGHATVLNCRSPPPISMSGSGGSACVARHPEDPPQGDEHVIGSILEELVKAPVPSCLHPAGPRRPRCSPERRERGASPASRGASPAPAPPALQAPTRHAWLPCQVEAAFGRKAVASRRIEG